MHIEKAQGTHTFTQYYATQHAYKRTGRVSKRTRRRNRRRKKNRGGNAQTKEQKEHAPSPTATQLNIPVGEEGEKEEAEEMKEEEVEEQEALNNKATAH